MVTVSSGANISTAPPRPWHTLPAKAQLSMADAPASATAPASLAVLLAKWQPLSAAAAAAYTAPPAAVLDDKVGSLTRLCKCSEMRDQRLCEYLWTVCQSELCATTRRTDKHCALQVERHYRNAYRSKSYCCAVVCKWQG
eukprot:1115-Heterococcus_DN1.PRE.2